MRGRPARGRHPRHADAAERDVHRRVGHGDADEPPLDVPVHAGRAPPDVAPGPRIRSSWSRAPAFCAGFRWPLRTRRPSRRCSATRGRSPRRWGRRACASTCSLREPIPTRRSSIRRCRGSRARWGTPRRRWCRCSRACRRSDGRAPPPSWRGPLPSSHRRRERDDRAEPRGRRGADHLSGAVRNPVIPAARDQIQTNDW